jgi:NAD(P)-dependent dehydrogenase (short-subunit alcohol dehydrogenase family)
MPHPSREGRSPLDLQLSDRRALVTGGSRGIGRSIVQILLEEGCRVAFCARSATAVTATAVELEILGTVTGTSLDVSDRAALSAWVAGTAERFGGLDIVVNNVSAQSFDWRKSVDTDLLACAHLMDLTVPYLRQSTAGAIVSISSLAGLMSVPSYKPYSAVKAGLVSFMGSLSRELAPQGIRVNTVSPGEVYFPGGFWDRMRTEEPPLYAQAVRRNILGRLGTPEDVARAVAFLASPAASFISGVNLLVDGAAHEFVNF